MASRKSRTVSADRFKKKSAVIPTLTDSETGVVRPINTIVHFPNLGAKGGNGRTYDMGQHYGKGFDDIVNRAFYTVTTLLGNPKDGSEETKHGYLARGFSKLSDYLIEWRQAVDHDLSVDDITQELIEGYKKFLKGLSVSYVSQKASYSITKALLTAMRKHRYWHIDKEAFDIVFPKNPYPKSNRRYKGARPLTEYEKRKLLVALKQDIKAVYDQKRTLPLTAYELTVCVLAMAMQTGINTNPLLNMTTNALSNHPLKKNRKLLTVYKKRGMSTQLHNLRKSEEVEVAQGVKLDVAYSIERIIELNEPCRVELGSDILLAYQTTKGKATTLSVDTLGKKIVAIIKQHALQDEDGKPLDINISRIRKTFINGIYELSGEDILMSAKAAKHKGTETIDHYLEAPEKAKRNLGLLGEIRVKNLTSDTDITPNGRCKDPVNGDKAPKNGSFCVDFLACFRCKSFVITGDDLYRLYSFYWAIVRNRDSFGRKDWKRHLRNILSVIDEEVEPEFASKGMLTQLQAERERARVSPHPYWKNLDMLRIGQ